ncbi:MAG: tetratricopeptide repeat protein, partial [Rhodanobacteraceae bacterium]
ILAWAFEVTPDGVRRTQPADSPQARPQDDHRRIGQLLNGVIIAVLLLAIAILAWRLWLPGRSESSRAVAAEAAPAATVVEPAPKAPSRKSIAVLPFENLSGDKDNEYFASGMQDMILTKLAAIGDLKVISRTSTRQYASHPDNVRTVGRELGVASILEGSVQKSGNAVLINVQLIDAASDAHIWAEAYTRTLDNVFGVEGEVAQKIADALKARLTATESASVAKVPTQNPAALDAYFQGEYKLEQAWLTWKESTFRAAAADYRRATELDPGFALAYARLAYSQLFRHWYTQPLSDAEMAGVKTTIDHALALAPALPEAYLALGYYQYWGFRRYDKARDAFNHVLQLAPNNAEAIAGLGYVARRDGHVEQAVSFLRQALELSPRDAQITSAIGETDAMLRRYGEAERYLRRALALAPDDANSKDILMLSKLFGAGDVAAARAVYRDPPGWRIAASGQWSGDVMNLINPRVYADFFDRHFDAALDDWKSAPVATAFERRTGRVARIVIRMAAGQTPDRAACSSLQTELEADLARHPTSLGALQQLAWMQVCLGRRAQAIATARKAMAVLPVSRDGYFGAFQVSGLAQIAAWAGDDDLALAQIRRLLAMPAGTFMTLERLKRDPIWDPLRNNPGFQALLAAPADRASATHRPEGADD